MSVFRCQCMCCLRRDRELNNYFFLSDSSLLGDNLEQLNKQLREEVEVLRKLGMDIASEKTKISHDKYRQLREENEKLKFMCDNLLDACEYYLPILEERLDCGAYMRQKLNWHAKKIKEIGEIDE